MPRDFKNFAQQKNKTIDENKHILEENKEKTNELESMINKYKNMNQSELLTSLFSEAIKLKQEGKLDSNSLNNLSSTLSPFLNSEQQEMLGSLINKINEQK